MDKITKTFDYQIKAVDAEKRTVDVLVSTASVDRHREIVLPEAFRKRLATYKKHPILLSSHDYSKLSNQIGRALAVRVTDDGLMAKFEYFSGEGNSEADWAFKLAEKGVAAFSVGFIAHQVDDLELKEEDYSNPAKATRAYKDVELVEISQVLIPSNRDAVQEQVKLTIARQSEMKELSESAMLKTELCVKALKSGIEFEDVQDGKKQEKVSPLAGESESEFMSRCVPKMKDEGMDQDQAVAACLNMWREKSAKPETMNLLVTPGQVLKAIRADDKLRDEFKEIVLEAMNEIAADDYYRELIFGKVVQSDSKPTLKDDLGVLCRKVAQDMKL